MRLHGAAALQLAALLLLLALLAAPLRAEEAAPTAQATVDATTQEMLTALREHRAELNAHPERIYDLVAEIALPKFDFETMSRLVLAQHWRNASPDQRSAFVVEFRNLLVRTYATALLEYEGQEIRYLPARPSTRPDQASVRTELVDPGTTPISIDYALLQRDQDWLVYDVAIDGVSLVTNYRGAFTSDIRQLGLDGLIERLAERNRRGQNGV